MDCFLSCAMRYILKLRAIWSSTTVSWKLVKLDIFKYILGLARLVARFYICPAEPALLLPIIHIRIVYVCVCVRTCVCVCVCVCLFVFGQGVENAFLCSSNMHMVIRDCYFHLMSWFLTFDLLIVAFDMKCCCSCLTTLFHIEDD